MNIDALRKKHKSTLVRHAFKITGRHEDLPAAGKDTSEWVDYLLQGGEIKEMLSALKNAKPIDLTLPDPNNFDASACSVVPCVSSLTLQAGEPADVDIRVCNGSHGMWESSEQYPIRISYHWYHANGDICVFDGVRTLLTRPLFPGKTSTILARIEPPHEAGNYLLEITLVWEGIFWFEDRGLSLQRIPVQVNRPKLPSHAQRIFQALMNAVKKSEKEVM